MFSQQRLVPFLYAKTRVDHDQSTTVRPTSRFLNVRSAQQVQHLTEALAYTVALSLASEDVCLKLITMPGPSFGDLLITVGGYLNKL